MYDKGMIFRADSIEAARWYEKASRQGHEKSGAGLAALAASRLAATSPAAGADTGAATPATAADTVAIPALVKPATGPVWRVQLASFRSAAEAEVAWRRLTSRLSDLLDGLKPETVEADLGPERGIYHRLTAGPLDGRAAARTLCRDIRQRAPRQGCLPLAR